MSFSLPPPPLLGLAYFLDPIFAVVVHGSVSFYTPGRDEDGAMRKTIVSFGDHF